MINKEILDIADKLKNVVDEQKKAAFEALNNVPEGQTKKELENLLKSASKGNLNHHEAQARLSKILKNAR